MLPISPRKIWRSTCGQVEKQPVSEPTMKCCQTLLPGRTKFHQRRVTTPSISASIYALHAPTFQMMRRIVISCTKTTAKGFVASSMELDARHWMCLPFAINCMLLSSIDACTTNRFLSPYSLANLSKSGTSLVSTCLRRIFDLVDISFAKICAV